MDITNSLKTFNVKETAKILGISKPTLDRWRMRGEGLNYIKVGNTIRYRLSDIKDYLDSHTVVATTTPKTKKQ